MKTLLLLFCYLLLISKSSVSAQNSGACSINGIENIDYTVFTISIDDTQVEDNIFTGAYDGNLKVTGVTGDGYKYFSITNDDTNFLISTTTQFGNIDAETPKTSRETVLITLTCTLECTGTSTLILQIVVRDTNNHAPTFSKESYEYNVAVPIMPRTDFTVYGDLLVATDIDFSNQNIVYTIQPDDFAISTLGTADSKDYTAIFSSRGLLLLSGSATYTITATDAGTPQRNTTATITINIDNSLSLDSPTFKEPSYSFNYSVKDNAPQLTPNNGAITLTTIKPDSVTSGLTLAGEFEASFKAEYDTSTSTIDLSVSELLTTTGSFSLLTLAVTTDGRASTSIIIYLPEEDNEAPQFSSHYYTATYDDVSNTVKLNSAIGVASTRTPEVSISDGEYADRFGIKYDESSKSYQISVKTGLTPAELKELSYTTLTLKASVDDHFDTAGVVLSLPKHILQFTKALYTASYNTDDTVTVDEDNPITFTTDVTGVSIAPDGTYSKNFDVTLNTETDQYEISVTDPISKDILKEENEIVLTLTASDAHENKAQSVVNIKLPDTNTDPPLFSEIVYVANYIPNDESSTISVEKDIVISNKEQSAVKITLDSYTENFDITYTDKKWVINVNKFITDDILNSKKEIIITLTASEENNDYTSDAVLIINWSTKEAPRFSQEYYKATYPKSGEGTIELNKDVSFINVENQDSVAVKLNSYKENFEITYSSSKWVLNIVKALNKSVISDNTELIIVLSATETDNKNEGNSILVLDLPNDTLGPKFEDAYYIAKYPESGSGNIDFEKTLKLINVDDPTTATITLDNYVDNFQVKYESDKWFISIQSNLDDAIVKENSELVITLTVSQTGNDLTGEAVLLLELPSADTPKFAQSYYTADYPEDGASVIEIEPSVQFSNIEDPSAVSISLDKYANNFELKYDSNRWYINLKESLKSDILKENTELLITLFATQSEGKETGEAVLVLKLPVTNDVSNPEFSKAYYVADYPESGSGIIEFKDPIQIANVDDPKTVTISLDNYAKNFEVVYSDRWYINILKSLNDTILQTTVELVITLTAKEEGNSKAGTSVLVLQLPTSEKISAPKFVNAFYVAQYPEEGTGLISFEPDVVLENVDDPTNLAITLDTYGDNFEVKYNAEDKKWYINILESLKENVLDANTQLLITLTAKDATNGYGGDSALIIKLPSAVDGTNLRFSEPYYLADYPESGTGAIDFETSVEFLNVENPANVAIRVGTYDENFEIKYDGTKWYIEIKNSLEGDDLQKEAELVIALIATETGNKYEAESALVLRLPTVTDDKAPKFSSAYYVAKYPETGTGTIGFQNALEITNVADQSSVTISLDTYADNFEVKYESDKWYIDIKEALKDSELHKNPEIVITLIATESGNSNTGKSALVLQLPEISNDTAPEFSEAYYIADYVEVDTKIIEFKTPIEFTNVDDQSTVTVTLDNYADKLEVNYDSGRFFLHILTSLDEDTKENTELCITLIATKHEYKNEGYSALVLKMPSKNSTSFKFAEDYYRATYPEKGKTFDFDETAPEFVNVEDVSKLKITLDKYSENFDIAFDSLRWFLYVKIKLNDTVLKQQSELVMKMTATDPSTGNVAYSVLVLELSGADAGPKFSDAYYLANYTETDTGVIEFENPVAFTNLEDYTTVEIALDSYTENFEIKYEDNRWYLKVNVKLGEPVLNANVELVMTLTASQTDNKNNGYSALVLRLPYSPAVQVPEFSDAYYMAEYPTDGSDVVELEKSISFKNVEDPSSLTVTLDNYADNFEIKYQSKKWVMTLKQALDKDVLNKNTELLITLTATETDNPNKGYSALVLKLPAADVTAALKFSEAYYVAKYPENDDKSIELDNAINILNVNDQTTITINLDNYSDNFEISYTEDKWILKINEALGEEILNKNRELAITMTATQTGNEDKAYSALIIELPSTAIEEGPVFSEAFYLADYPEEYTGVIDFVSPIAFKNVKDISKVTINLNNYVDYFEVLLDSDKWIIKVKKNLEDSMLDGNSELVMKLIATESDSSKEGYSALVLRLPVKEEIAPIFTEAYYTADYGNTDGEAKVVFTSPIDIKNKDDISDILISVDNYNENFDIEYDSETKSWSMRVSHPLSDDVLLEKTDIVVALTATNQENKLTNHAVVDLSLPYLNTDKAPKFSKTYYTARYSISGGKGLVTFDTPLKITNKENLEDISISLDNYINYFNVTYDDESDSWQMNVANSLDQWTLNRKLDLVMALTASEKDNDEMGQTVLLMRLPVVNNDEAPKYSSIYYSGTYLSGTKTVKLDEDIAIMNKEDLSKVTITCDDSYRDNFEITYDDDALQWALNVKNELSDDIFKDNLDLILTLTATETDNSNIGQAALVLQLPSEEIKLPPKFNLAHYSANYVVENNKASIKLDDTITVDNKVDLSNVQVSLDTYESNFAIKFDSSKSVWNIGVVNPISEDIFKTTRELVLTLTAKETDNGNEGQATLIITLPSSDTSEKVIAFSLVHYSADYGNDGTLTMNDKIEIITEGDLKDLKVSIDSEVYSKYFTIGLENDAYVVKVGETLPPDILKETFIILTLVATLGTNEDHATLIINMPTTDAETGIRFAEPLYTGSYAIVEGKVNFNVDSKIQIDTEEADANVEKSFSSSTGYESYFQIDYADKIVSVTLAPDKEIPTDVLRNNPIIPLVLTVGITGTSSSASSVLNVAIKYNEDERSIAFSGVLYHGTYEVTEGEGTLTITDIISLTTDEPDSNVNVVITNAYDSFFTVQYSTGIVKITQKSPLTEEIINGSSVVPLTLQAKIKDTEIQSTAVVNLEILYDSTGDTDFIQFGSVLYTGQYSSTGGKGSLVLDDTIKIATESPAGQIEAKISEDTVYREYFTVSYASNVLTVALKDDALPDEVESNSFIALTLVVEITGTVHKSSAVLNINIKSDNNDNSRSIAFSEILYHGKYEVTDGDGTLTITDTISLTTDEPDSNVNVVITNAYDSFFTVQYSTGIVKITQKSPLTEEIINGLSVVPLTLQAKISETEIQSTAVVNLEILYDSTGDTDFIQFGSVLYTGQYSSTDGKGSLVLDDTIKVATESPAGQIEAKISEDTVYREYFTVSYASNVLTVALKDDVLPDKVESNSFIALTLVVEITGTVHKSSAVLNINIKSNNVEDGSIVFSQVLYTGIYKATDDAPTLSTDEILIVTDESDSVVEITITNQYASFFSVKYSKKTVTVGIVNLLPSDILDSVSVVPLTLRIAIKGTSETDTAVLNIEIKNDGDVGTDSIVFTSVLYNGEYRIKNGNATFVIDDSIEVISNRPDSEIIPGITEDSSYRDYFSIAYAGNAVTVKLTKTLPSDAVKSNSFFSLTLTVRIVGSLRSASAVLNIEIDNEDQSDDDDQDSKTELDHLRITFIVVTAVLSVLLLACIAGALAFYFLKVRKDGYSDLEEDGSGKVRFGKLNRTLSGNKSSAIEERRPTGFVFQPISEDMMDTSDAQTDAERARRKSVAFDDNVEKMQIEPVNDDDTDLYSNDKSQVTQV